MDDTGYISWVNDSGNANFPYVNDDGTSNFNWTDRSFNENWLWLVFVQLAFIPRYQAGFIFKNLLAASFCQPPSILPICPYSSEKVAYFLASSVFVSHATCMKNLSRSNLTLAVCKCGILFAPVAVLARNIVSSKLVYNLVILAPSVYR